MTCTHTVERSRWVSMSHDPFSAGEWEYWTEYTTVDLDLHRYQCTQCGEIMYYSGRARAYHEQGVLSDITGLDK